MVINSEQISSAAKTTARGFTQPRKITLQDVLLFYTFRHCETTNKDITSFFSKINKPKVSKQAMFKALDKTNPEVFPTIIREYARLFYEHQDYKTLDGWIVLACDGTKMDLPPSPEMKDKFGGSPGYGITQISQLRKPQAACSVLVDILNHVILDASVRPYRTSELPMLYEHLENCKGLLKEKKVILLCDRYYGSAELFYYCKSHGYHLLTRAKSYMYKEQVQEIETDGRICLTMNNAWLKRFKREDCRTFARLNPELNIRVVKSHYEFTMISHKRKQAPVVIDSTYMTDLPEATFSPETTVALYHKRRWDSETTYFGIKNHLEAERFNSGKYNIVVNELYGKIFCYSICDIIFNRTEDIILKKHSKKDAVSTAYDTIPNMKYICDMVRTDHKFLMYLQEKHLADEGISVYLTQLEDDCSRNIVPVRPGRHYQRWGRWMSSPPSGKFRIDGRRNPLIKKCFNEKGYITKPK